MLYTSLYVLLDGAVLDFDRINKLLNHLVFLLSCMLIQNFVGQMLPRGLLYVVAKERSFIFRVTHLD
jgi:hypothetical protein